MRHRKENVLRIILTGVLFIISLMLIVSPMINNNFLKLYSENEISNLVNIGTWTITVLDIFISIKLYKPVLKPETYCRDSYFIDRFAERAILFSFLDTPINENSSLFFVKGGMCRGKTYLLQKFADDVNHVGFKNSFQKKYPKSRKFTAYYIELGQSHQSLIQEIANCLDTNITISTCEKLNAFLRKSSYRKNTVLIIDNISKAQSHILIETARSLLYKNTHLKIVIGITEETGVNNFCTLTPPLFGEMHINELARIYKKKLTPEGENELMRISSGIPSYIRIIFRTDVLDKPIALSNIEDIQKIVNNQLSKLGADNEIAAYLSCLKLCQKEPISKEELLLLAKASESQLDEIFDAALAHQKISSKRSYIIMDSLVAQCCLRTIAYQEYLLKIYTFYKEKNTENDVILITALLSPNIPMEKAVLKNVMHKKYSIEKNFFLFIWLGDLDQERRLLTLYKEPILYNSFRYFYLSSLLQLGEYTIAMNTLKDYEISTTKLPSLRESNLVEGFEMQYLIIDLHHLSNRFTLALGEIESILSTMKICQDNMNRLLYLKAHCLKHLGADLHEADRILNDLRKRDISKNLYLKTIYSQMAIHLFWGDKSYDYETDISFFNVISKDNTPGKLHAMRHLAHYTWKQKGDITGALKIIDDGLDILEKTRWRIIYDFYFEKAEWMRIQNIEANNKINDVAIILNFYQKALQFAEENLDVNLACCAKLGKILTIFAEHSSFECNWYDKQLQILEQEYTKMNSAELNINKAYVAYVKTLMLKEEPSDNFIYYCKANRYYDLYQHIENGLPLKLTVM